MTFEPLGQPMTNHIQLVRDAIDQIDAAPFGKVGALLDGMAVNADKAIASQNAAKDALLKLVRHAFNLGLTAGMKEYTSSKGGNTWAELKPDLEQRLDAALSHPSQNGRTESPDQLVGGEQP